MSHMIRDNQIAWKDEVPWHGLGYQVDPDATGIQMLKKAGLNWTVSNRELAMLSSDKDEKKRKVLTEPLTNYRAIARDTDDRVFQVGTQRYNIVQNQEIVDIFREYCEAGDATMDVVGALNGGNVIWALAKLNPKMTDVQLKGGDRLQGYSLFASSHDGSLRTIGHGTQIRVVCHNTLSAAIKGKKLDFELKHSAEFTQEMKKKAKAQLGLAVETVQRTNEAAAKLSEVSIDHSDWLTFMSKLWGTADDVLNPKTAELTPKSRAIHEAMTTSPGSQLASARGTLWGAVNGVTWYADHERGRTQDNRMYQAWFGSGKNLKEKALEVALELATVGA